MWMRGLQHELRGYKLAISGYVERGSPTYTHPSTHTHTEHTQHSNIITLVSSLCHMVEEEERERRREKDEENSVIYSQGGSASENIAYACCTCRVAEQRDSSIMVMITTMIMMMMMMMVLVMVMVSLMLRHDGHLLWLIALKPHDLPLKRDTFLRHFRFSFRNSNKNSHNA